MFPLICFPSITSTSYMHGKTLLLFSHLLQAVSGLSFRGLIKILKLITKPFHFQDFSKENVNFVEYLCKPSRVFKSWNEIKSEYNLEGSTNTIY